MINVLASANAKTYEIELDLPLKENDYVDIEGREYYVYGPPVLVLKPKAWTDGGFMLNYQSVKLELRN